MSQVAASAIAPVAAKAAFNAGTGALIALPFSVMGIPAWGLAAAITGAFCSYLPQRAKKDRDIPAVMFGVGRDAFIGGWIAVFLVSLTLVKGTGIERMPIEILCGLGAFAMQWLTLHAGPAFERLLGGLVVSVVSAVSSWIKRPGSAPNTATPAPEPTPAMLEEEPPR